MKRMPFEPPTKHYDERIKAIDEQICHLIKQRKDISNNNPGFPPRQLITAWSEKYNLYKEFLNGVFGHFFNEEIYKPVVEPKGFIKNIPILKSFEKDNSFYSVTFISQFENASVIHLTTDRDSFDELDGDFHRRREFTFFDISIEGVGTDYDCRHEGGGGSGGHTSYTFIVSPPLPEENSTLNLVFKEYKTPLKTKPTGLEFVIKLDN
ncbi:hypothetical protein HPT25_26145 [Bacillus sp. BRMEA1]|uniref:hypothetical protein n=1 Tax=Neobacillus endophyticus TaxID=2738405 RepID=UPI001563C859|nr:hypothetical protein [Neobacillus endophyticus]NRD80813.1 hypothetical protein [Neobacillus endophyticus]